MFTFSVNFGQLIIATLLATIGYFVKKEIHSIGARLNKHDDILYKLIGDVQRLIGLVDRRKESRSN